jgi:hypothetical protein
VPLKQKSDGERSSGRMAGLPSDMDRNNVCWAKGVCRERKGVFPGVIRAGGSRGLSGEGRDDVVADETEIKGFVEPVP